MFAQPSPRQSQSHSSRSSIGGQCRRSRRARRTRCRLSRGPLAFEPLEDRTLLSVFTVSTPDDVIDATDGVRSLREAVIAANANPGPDQISLEAATYSLTRAGAGEDGAFSGDLDIFTDELLILGDSASTSIIDAGGTIGLGDRVFHVRSTATISGVTIRGGVTTGFGGGILNSGTLTIRDSIIRGNGSAHGGGIANIGASARLTLEKTQVLGNGVVAAGLGGGIYNDLGSMIIRDSTIGGVPGNFADFGGGIFNASNQPPNRTEITGSTISDNSASPGGGALAMFGLVTMTNTTISQNFGGLGGGGILVLAGELALANVTIFGNSTTGEIGGGGILNSTGDVTAKNTIIAGNTAPTGPDISGTLASKGFNLIGSTSGMSFAGSSPGPGDITGVSATAVLNPTLAENGGPTKTHKLLETGPAINAADTAQFVADPSLGLVLQIPTIDQRGANRIGQGSRFDIGAFEFVSSPYGEFQHGSPGDLIVTGTDLDDTLTLVVDPSTSRIVVTHNGNPVPIIDASTGAPCTEPGGLCPTTANTQSISVDTLSGSDGLQLQLGAVQFANVTVNNTEVVSNGIAVGIDIKPGSFPNSINLGSSGVVPVAILSSATFDATTVDPLTVTLAGSSVRLKGNGTPMASKKDVNGDGLVDLEVQVETEALDLTNGDTLAVLRGQTTGGVAIGGVDSVRVVASALHVASGSAAAGLGSGSEMLDPAIVGLVVDQALSLWLGTGIDPHRLSPLTKLPISIVDLSGSLLALASPLGIWLDRDAAGYGWSIGSASHLSAIGRVDLLSVVAHELGHVLGFDHSDEHDVMGATLAPGEQRSPLRSLEDLHGHHPYSVLTGSLLEPRPSSERRIDSQALDSAALLFEEWSVVQREDERMAVQAQFVAWRNRSAIDLLDYVLGEEEEDEGEEQLLDELARELVGLRR